MPVFKIGKIYKKLIVTQNVMLILDKKTDKIKKITSKCPVEWMYYSQKNTEFYTLIGVL